MQENTIFAAEILRRRAAGFAGEAASLLLERDQSLAGQGGAFSTWKGYLTHRVIELAAALAADEPRLFSERLVWSRKMFIARGQDTQVLEQSLACLRDYLAGHLPAKVVDVTSQYIDAALKAISGAAPELDASELDPTLPMDRLALLFLEQALEGNSNKAAQLLLDAVDSGTSVTSIYVDVLLPAQREIGRLWHFDDVTVAEEHLVSATTMRAMAVLSHLAPRKKANGKTVVAACVQSNTHDIGIRALSDIFHLDGWKSIYLGADVPNVDMPSALSFFSADLLLLSGTLSTHIAGVTDVIAKVREVPNLSAKILVGGAAFDGAHDTWKQTGADAYESTPSAAVQRGAQLVGL